MTVRRSHPSDTNHLSNHLRAADQAELEACGLSPRDAVQSGIMHSKTSCVIERHGDPIFLFGSTPTAIPSIGAVWGFGTDAYLEIARLFARESTRWIDWVSQGYAYVGNWMDVRNELHRRWLEWSGFTFAPGCFHHGPQDLPFYKFLKKV